MTALARYFRGLSWVRDDCRRHQLGRQRQTEPADGKSVSSPEVLLPLNISPLPVMVQKQRLTEGGNLSSQPKNVISVCYKTELEPVKEGKVEQLAVVEADVEGTCQNSR
jgi:hypothetical protein